MIGLRDKGLRRFGAALAALAVSLQLALASWGMLALSPAGEAADAFGGHALCLAASDNASPAPSDTGQTIPAHNHAAFCCSWHSPPGITPQAALTTLPVAYAPVALDAATATVIETAPPRGPAAARAPPIQA
jgi:hypothetical protein